MARESGSASRDARNGRRLSPTARHFFWLALYYLVVGVGIGAVERVDGIALPSTVAADSAALVGPVSSAPSAPSRNPRVSAALGAIWSEGRGQLLLRTTLGMLGAIALALPVAWVYLITRRRKGFTQSIVHTLLVLPIAVSGIMMLVQNSLALAFSLAGLAVLRFRNTLDDTKDTIYLFVATGIGIAAAVGQLDVGLALSLIFNAAILVLWWTDVGRTPSRLKAELTMRRLRATMEMRARTMEHAVPVAIPASARDSLNAILRVHVGSIEPAQAAVESVLSDSVKQWELTGVTPGEHGRSMLDYVVRLRSKTPRAGLLNDLRTRGTPHVIGAEYR